MADLFPGTFQLSAASASSSIADALRRQILSGELKPDQPINERAVAEELGVSRTPVREALFVLQGEGLVELSPRRYARVRRITASDISQIYLLRRTLEAHSAEMAATFADSEGILRIETALIRQKNLPRDCSAVEQVRADLAFHAAIAEASGSKLAITVVTQVLSVTATIRSRLKYEKDDLKRAMTGHKELLSAIKSRDPVRARDLMTAHINESIERLAAQQGLTPA